jgi:Pyruvate-formate lyase-activating enzyme
MRGMALSGGRGESVFADRGGMVDEVRHPGPIPVSGPLIADVKRHSIEDGLGIRSVVFFKGCPLRCVFCQNPETQSREVEIVFSGGMHPLRDVRQGLLPGSYRPRFPRPHPQGVVHPVRGLCRGLPGEGIEGYRQIPVTRGAHRTAPA